MKVKPLAVALTGVMSLFSTVGCGRADNTANAGHAAGFVGNTVVRPLQQGANLVTNGVTGVPDRVPDVIGAKPVVYIDSATRTMDLRVHGSPRGGVITFPHNGLHIAVPTGWTVIVSGPTPRIGNTLSIVSYQGGVVGAKIVDNLGANYKVATPGQYAVVSVVPGRPNKILDIITVSSGVSQPTIVPHSF